MTHWNYSKKLAINLIAPYTGVHVATTGADDVGNNTLTGPASRDRMVTVSDAATNCDHARA